MDLDPARFRQAIQQGFRSGPETWNRRTVILAVFPAVSGDLDDFQWRLMAYRIADGSCVHFQWNKGSAHPYERNPAVPVEFLRGKTDARCDPHSWAA